MTVELKDNLVALIQGAEDDLLVLQDDEVSLRMEDLRLALIEAVLDSA